jgi:hypothetical protein
MIRLFPLQAVSSALSGIQEQQGEQNAVEEDDVQLSFGDADNSDTTDQFFDSLDTKRGGKVSRSEFKQAFQSLPDMTNTLAAEEEPSTEEEDDPDPEDEDETAGNNADAAAVIAAGGPDLLGDGENVSDEQLGELLSFRRAVFTLKELNPTPEQLVQIASGMTTADEHVVKLARHLLDSQDSA